MHFKNLIILPLLLTCALNAYSKMASAATPIQQINSKYGTKNISFDKIKKIILQHFNIDDYSQVNIQLIHNKRMQPDHYVIYFLHKYDHSLTIARINVDHLHDLISIEKNYQLTLDDLEQQPGKKLTEAQCPDPDIQFIAFAPNNIDLEQKITKDVAETAQAKRLKTVSLLLNNATRENYFNYLVCPQVKGNFYDGNANSYMITTADGVILHEEIKTILANKFRYKVTNVWVAGEAFENPLESALIDVAKAQKYVAGLNGLSIGPADETGACVMKAAIIGDPITSIFKICYQKYGSKSDRWGVGGYGSDYFGQ